MPTTYYLNVTKVKGVPCKAKVIWTEEHLIGDCSSYTVGAIGTYLDSGISKDVLAQLMAHYLIASKSSFNSPQGNRVKFLFTNSRDKFENHNNYMSAKVWQALDTMAGKFGARHITEVNGWHGDPFEFRILEVEKNPDRQVEADIAWQDYEFSLHTCVTGQSEREVAARYAMSYKTLKLNW